MTKRWPLRIRETCGGRLPAREGFVVGFDAGAAVPSPGSWLDCGQACGGGGGGPRGGDPPQETRVETPPQTLHTERNNKGQKENQTYNNSHLEEVKLIPGSSR